jgi:hypothetical protein
LPPPGLCAGREEAKRQKRSKGRKRRDEVRHTRHLQTLLKRQSGERL